MPISSVKKLVFTAVCAALCLVLPMAFHAIPNAGQVMLPMHIPVLLCGLVCGWPYGALCGLAGPFLSSVITAMPPAAMLPSMLVECAVYGFVSGVLMKYVRTGRSAADLYISLISAMAAGRIAAGFAKAWIFTPGISPFAWVTTSLVTGIPGVVLQLAVLPLVVAALSRARLIPNRYPKGV